MLHKTYVDLDDAKSAISMAHVELDDFARKLPQEQAQQEYAEISKLSKQAYEAIEQLQKKINACIARVYSQ